jgi:virulence-associated protein VapD
MLCFERIQGSIVLQQHRGRESSNAVAVIRTMARQLDAVAP